MDRVWLITTGYDQETDTISVKEVSEQEIYETYYPQWLVDKVSEYGQQWVDENLTFENCLQDWAQSTDAWQLK